MIKIIRDFVEKPQFMVLCDCACGTYAAAPFEAGSFEERQLSVWGGELMRQGWKITLFEQVCPAHVKKQAENGKMIIIPNLAAASLKN